MSGRVLPVLRRTTGGIVQAMLVVRRDRPLLRSELSWGAAWTAEWVFTTVLSVYAYRQGGVAAVGGLGVARMVPTALSLPLATAIVDRVRRERVILWGGVLRGGCIAAAAVAAAAGAPALVVYALAVLATMAFGPYVPAHTALLPALCRTPVELTSANVVRGFVDAVSVLLGPLLAAAVLAVSGVVGALAVAAALSVASGAVLARLGYEATTPSPGIAEGIGFGQLTAGLRVLSRDADTRAIVLLGAGQSAVRGALTVFIVALAVGLLGLGDPGVGLLNAALGAGGVVGAVGSGLLVAGRGLAAWFGVGIALWSAPLAFVAAWPVPGAAFALLGLIGVANALVDVTGYTLLQRIVPERVLGRVLGTLTALVFAGGALGAAAAPLLIAALGLRTALLAVGLLLPPAVALTWRRLRRIDRGLVVRDEDLALLDRIEFLRPLAVPTMQLLAHGLRRAWIAAGQPVFRQGDAGDRFYIIAAGEADVIHDGKPLRRLTTGAGFGEIALLHDVPRTATVQAVTELDLRAIDRVPFLLAVSGSKASTGAAAAATARMLARTGPPAPTSATQPRPGEADT